VVADSSVLAASPDSELELEPLQAARLRTIARAMISASNFFICFFLLQYSLYRPMAGKDNVGAEL
jgi:hypothetical protein